MIRLIHPFPSLLNGAITAGLVVIAGGSGPTALRLGLAMVTLQTSIGALNDLLDAPHDAGRKLGKPIPAGLVGVRQARGVVLVGLALGLGLAAASGLPTFAVAAAGVAAGYVYDVRLKGTAVSWAPFAVGIPLLPVFAWVGAGVALPASFVILVPLAALAGSGLAIANALADYERDLDAGTASVATRLGVRRAWSVHATIQVLVVVGAVVAAGPTGGGEIEDAIRAGGAGLVIVAGVVLARSASPARRELAWEVEAAGTGLLGVVWLAAVVTAA